MEAEFSDLTASQLAIWTGQELQPDEPLYNMALAFWVDGHIDPLAFETAFERLVAESDSLRAVFEVVDDKPRQRFLDAPPAPVVHGDFSAEGDPRAAAMGWMRARTRNVFQLDECLYECALMRLADDRWVIYLNQHHLITDASAVAIAYRRLAAHYLSICGNSGSELEAPPSFREHIESEKANRNSALSKIADTYWNERLGEAFQASQFYRERAVNRSGVTLRSHVAVGAERSNAIRQLARHDDFASVSEDLARFQIFCTTLAAYLHRICDNDRIAIGTPTHNRTSRRLKNLVGLLIEVLPLRVTVDSDETFESLYGKIGVAAREMLMHAPPGTIDARHARSFDVVLNYITASYGEFAGLPARSEWLHPDSGDRNHVMRLQVHDFDQSGSLELHFDLNEDVFSSEERRWVSEHFLRLMDAFLADPTTPIGNVALIDDSHPDWPDATPVRTLPENESTVVALIARQAQASPSAPAIECGEDVLSYAELERHSNAVAAGIQARLGDTPGPVAILMQRSPDAVAAILGTLKSGRPYVPIDPHYPAKRIEFILDDSGAPLVLADGTIGRDDDSRVVHLDGLDSDDTPTLAPPRPDDPAYIIYTSGSTGQPKGVRVSHRNLAHYIDWANRFYLRGRPLAFALFSSISFDLTVTSIFTPLAGGGRIVVYPETDQPGDITIRRVIEDRVAEIIKLTPAHLSLLQAMDLTASPVKTLILGGEDLKTALAKSILGFFGDGIELYNEYGPTEGTVACMIHRYDRESDTALSVPIGQAIDHARIYLLDAGLNPVPRGVRGQIFIGGAGVAAGYHDRDELTQERFLPDPFSTGARMYATGDVGRRNSAGILEFLGRSDAQIKIRGVRIEPGEIEAVLRDQPGITDCAVVARTRTLGFEQREDEPYCRRCGLEGRHPQAELDDESICRVCRKFERDEVMARSYFRSMSELESLAARMRAEAKGQQDCIMLLSGGKDSSYALYRLVDLGLTPLVFTLDNGYISEGAKDNIRRVVDGLGLELVVGETAAMNEIFVDSLQRFSNVCEGCFKTIYTLSTQLALDRGINYICTGLSRGQIFQTRVADLFRQNIFDADEIDRTIIDARKAYHRLDDVVARSLNTGIFADDDVYETVKFVDFYRYCDVSLDEVLHYLSTRAPWVRPADTGRSTNCLINEAGIFVHKRQRGHHNYSLPYSWDVRLGHKDRDAAREELDDDINEQNVRRILTEIGYSEGAALAGETRDTYLTAYYTGTDEMTADEIRQHLGRELPAELVPRHIVRLDALPLTANGKLDTRSLPDPASAGDRLRTTYRAPQGWLETELTAIWSDVLGMERLGVDDNFFDLGGDSILNIQIVARARRSGIEISPQQLFDAPTVHELAGVATRIDDDAGRHAEVSGSAPLTPIQRRFVENNGGVPSHYCQTALIEVDYDEAELQGALNALLASHAALRMRFYERDGRWVQEVGSASSVPFESIDLGKAGLEARQSEIDRLAGELARRTDPSEGANVRAAFLRSDNIAKPLLLIVAHHLVIDGVSWWILLDDLETVLESAGKRVPALPASTLYLRWALQLEDYRAGLAGSAANDYWTAGPAPDDARPASAPGHRSARQLRLSRRDTLALTREAAGRFRAQTPELLLAGLAAPLQALGNGNAVVIDIEAHGREAHLTGADLTRTVGWFTTIHPIVLDTDGSDTQGAAAVANAKDAFRAPPQQGFDYGVLRYLGDDDVARSIRLRWPSAAVLFNYLGQWNSRRSESAKLRFATPIGLTAGDDIRPRYPLEINAVVFDGELEICVDFDSDRYAAAQIDALLEAAGAALSDLAKTGAGEASAALTPSDFPAAELSQAELDAVLDEFGE